MTDKLKYNNITISGLPGAGSSTLGKALAKILGWEYFSSGDFMRSYAIEKGLFDPNEKTHHLATVYGEEFDREVDFGLRKTLKDKRGRIMDGWLTGFFAQKIEAVLKVLVVCSDDSIRVDRVVNRDNISVAEAKKHIFERELKNNEKWSKVYKKEWLEWIVSNNTISSEKPVWFWYRQMYNMTIDTFKNSKQQTLKTVLGKLGYTGKVDYKKIFG